MVDWKSPQEIAKDAMAFDRVVHAFLGVYVWEWIISFNFDWLFIRGRKPFRWPMIFYFLNRYCWLFASIGTTVALNLTTEVNCQALFTFTMVLGSAAIGLSSINLSIRTMVVWSYNRLIVIPLVLIIIGNWGLLLRQMSTIQAAWIPGQGCVITNTNPHIMLASFLYTMVLDFIVMMLTAIKLIGASSGTRSRLVRLIFTDGLIYFIVTFLSHVASTTLMAMDLNPVMTIIANFPNTTISTILACRVVRRLSTFSSSEPETFSSSGRSKYGVRSKVSSRGAKDGVHMHVKMETFESPPSDTKENFRSYEPSDQTEVGKSSHFDLESQSNQGIHS